MIYKTIDLCAGIGGIRRGFELTGRFENVLSAEIDELACQTYELLFGENPYNDLTSEEFKRKVSETNYDVLLAGFPCQAFSRVGKQEGFQDRTKGTIFFDIAEIIRRTHPKMVFLENVENLVRHDKGHTFQIIIQTLEEELDYKIIGVTRNLIGEPSYDPHSFIRNSKDFGIPQNRPRVYIAAFSRKYYGEHVFDLPEVLPSSRKEAPIYTDVNEVLETGDIAPKFFLSEGYLETLEKHKVRQLSKGYGFGMKIVNDPAEERHISSALLATGGSGRERNLIIDKQNGQKYAGMLVKDKKSPINSKNIRTMVPAEWGRLQGFIDYAFVDENGNDHFAFPKETSDIQRYKQFGNSVTIPVIETMAEFMFRCAERMKSGFSATEKRLYSLYGKNFLMSRKICKDLEGRGREETILKWVDAYNFFGTEKDFSISLLAKVLDCKDPWIYQHVLPILKEIGLVKKVAWGKYKFDSEYLGKTVSKEEIYRSTE